ncbi:MAG: DUF1800 family protein [Roseibacillus sp.]
MFKPPLGSSLFILVPLLLLVGSLSGAERWEVVQSDQQRTLTTTETYPLDLSSRSLSDGRLRFVVTCEQSAPADPITGQYLAEEWHELTFRFNDTLLGSVLVEAGPQTFFFEVNSNEAADETNNSFFIERSSGSPGGSLAIDSVTISYFDRGESDDDGDGLPLYWEVENGFSPEQSDSTEDRDGDGLTAEQEWLHGTSVYRADSDDDGISDGAEVAAGLNPLQADSDNDGLSDQVEIEGASDGLLVDTDGDGSPDAWEKHTGTDPRDPAQTATSFGQTIALQFVSAAKPQIALPSFALAGPVPQINWNTTSPLATGATSGAESNLLLGDGSSSGVTASWTGLGTTTCANAGSVNGRLFGGIVYTLAEDTTPVEIVLSNIPFQQYDLYVLLAGRYTKIRGAVEVLQQPDSRVHFATANIAPNDRFLLANTKPQELTDAIEGLTDPDLINRFLNRASDMATYAHFKGLQGPTATIQLSTESYQVGISAIQIVDTSSDRDNDGLPDWWEFTYQTNPEVPDAASDLDNDGLQATDEYTRGSDPRTADSDQDGVLDPDEGPNSSASKDTDRDGISDWLESQLPRPSNPELADTDGDGVNDADEVRDGTDPTNASIFEPRRPTFDSETQTWTWRNEIQIVWDHHRSAQTVSIYGPQDLITLHLGASTGTTDAWEAGLSIVDNEVRWRLLTRASSSFGFYGYDLYRQGAVDLKVPLGFSGYGAADVSAILGIEQIATREFPNENLWSLTYRILNLDEPEGLQLVFETTLTGLRAAPSADNGQEPWVLRSKDPGAPRGSSVLEGASLYFEYPPLEPLPAFAETVDSDSDGIPDEWEQRYGMNPYWGAGADGDEDGDGLSARMEFTLGLDPQQQDTDNDQWSDFAEWRAGSDPADANSIPPLAGFSGQSGEDFDLNGLSDIWELSLGYPDLNPFDDPDGDGYHNQAEAIAGTDPFDKDSAPSLTLGRQDGRFFALSSDLPFKKSRLFVSEDLLDWETTEWGPSEASWELFGERNFVRLEVGNNDQDGDGLSDWAEAFLGSDPTQQQSLGLDSLPQNDPSEENNAILIPGDLAAAALRLGSLPGEMSTVEAARFLSQATFGPTVSSINHLRSLGYDDWFTEQMEAPPSFTVPYAYEMIHDYHTEEADQGYYRVDFENFVPANNFTTSFYRGAIAGPDQLRQRMAFALSQILVVSRMDAILGQHLLGVSSYYDILIEHSLGNYLDLMREVTWDPCMGTYLSHIGNERVLAGENRNPDENYARELMQLFTIGLWELNRDGSRKTDDSGNEIPTYTNADISQLARVFTGHWYGGQPWGYAGWQEEHFAIPMRLDPSRHDFGEKTFLGQTFPERAPTLLNAETEIDAALQVIFEHPNTAPFVSRALIQFFVTSNPSPAYIDRVAQVFEDDGLGERGNLAAVAQAILLDPEAQSPSSSVLSPTFGKMQEPVIRATRLARLGGLDQKPKALYWQPTPGTFEEATLQTPLLSSSVFNFFQPDHRPRGLTDEGNLVEPVFQITDSFTSIAAPVKLWEIIEEGFVEYGAYQTSLDWSREAALARDTDHLLEHLNIMCCNGGLSVASRATIRDAVNSLPPEDYLTRARLAIQLVTACPEAAVQR